MKKVDIDTNSLAHTKWNCKYHTRFSISLQAPVHSNSLVFLAKTFP
jgi:hypothetical protein